VIFYLTISITKLRRL